MIMTSVLIFHFDNNERELKRPVFTKRNTKKSGRNVYKPLLEYIVEFIMPAVGYKLKMYNHSLYRLQ